MLMTRILTLYLKIFVSLANKAFEDNEQTDNKSKL
jgi:hypothetical protein